MRVLLASMPFSSLHYPSIGLSLLKPALRRIGIDCDIRYFSLDFADRVGAGVYDTVTDERCYQALIGEWVFAGAANGEGGSEAAVRYLSDSFAKSYPELYSAERLMAFLAARENASAFIDDCLGAVEWAGYDVVGFTSSFQQNMASIALARRIKERSPETAIVFGGANCRGEMGIELLSRYAFIDAVCLDEGDRVFPEFVDRRRSGAPCHDIPAMAVRTADGRTAVPLGTADPIENLDELPDPDFSDFFDQHAQSSAAAAYPPAVLIETARGCWWGAKHHCTFCGINGRSMAFRSKSQSRAYDEIARLASRYGSDFVSVDSIIDHRYFEELLPRLAAEGPAITMYCELKANLRPDQVELLSRAGAKKIQPGIEALDTDVLRLMRKGCTALQNVQTLKLAAESGIYVEWNLLHGFPGERRESYERTAALIPALRHLQPPRGVGRVRADRFSPYFERPDEYGVALDPLPAYRVIYPFDERSVRRLAYHFEMRTDRLDGDAADAEDPAAPAVSEAALWQAHQRGSALTIEDLGDVVVVTDERWGWPRNRWEFEGCVADLYRLCWRMVSRRTLYRELVGRYGQAEVECGLRMLSDLGILMSEGENVLALALRQPGFRRAPDWEEIRDGRIVPYTLRSAALPA